MKPESVAVTMDGEQNVPNATESDNLMNESHTTEKEVTQESINEPVSSITYKLPCAYGEDYKNPLFV